MAGIRMTGLISNMDTESIVESMMDAHRLKLTKIENKKTVLEWKQDKWKDLNTKLYKLYQEQTSKLHLTSNYKTKKVTSADESVVKVTADKNASEGTHSIIVKQLASSQYVTGGKLDSSVKGTTKLSEIDKSLVGNKITIETSKGQTVLDITDKTTVNDFTRACTNAGLNASYDEKQNRFFISSTSSGIDQGFTITASDYSSNSGMLDAKNKIVSSVGSKDTSAVYNALNSIEAQMGKIGDGSEQAKKDFINDVLKGNVTKDDIEKSSLSDEEKAARISILENVETIANATISQADSNLKSNITTAETEALKKEILDTMKNSEDGFYEKKVMIDGEEKTLRVEIPKATDLDGKTEEEISALVDTAMASSDMKELLNYNVSTNFEAQKDANQLDAYGKLSTSLETYVSGTGATTSNALDILKIGNITQDEITGEFKSDYSGSKVISAADSIVEYNGVELTGSSNSITVNGLTFEAISVSDIEKTDPVTGEVTYKSTSITVTKDTQGMYDMVKDFITQYNTILGEMNELYYADSARGYDPLTDEEKEAMTDDQIKMWEDKIKNASLRRDSTLGGISSAMKEAMSSTVEVDGKKYSLASFGIMTSRDYTEKGLLHIYGDKDDSTYADKDDKLMKAIEEDPDTFAKVMAGITDNLHTAMNKKMSKTSLSSALTFYNDKQIENQLTQYKKDISKMETKLEEKEAAYYKQFTAMEKALASLQEQQSALSGLLGNS